MVKVKRLPLPEPWNADAAVLHLYRVWSNQCRVQLRRITLLNPNMVAALKVLWLQDHRHVSNAQGSLVPNGVLVDIGCWHLLLEQDGSGVIVIEQRKEDV